jgi:alpha-tubulin suppressor-like RCC1 family protein
MGRFIGIDKTVGAISGAASGVFAGTNFSQIYDIDSAREYKDADILGIDEPLYLVGYNGLTLSAGYTLQDGHPWLPDSYSWAVTVDDSTIVGTLCEMWLAEGQHAGVKSVGTTSPYWILKDNGELWLWGTNTNGELGQNNTTNSVSSPVQVAGNWIDFEARSGECFGVKSDGTLWSWGSDASIGVLGHNVSNVNRSSPTQVGALTNWDSVYHGTSGSFVYALKTDGTVWAWGNGAAGALGHNATTSRSSPVQIMTGVQSLGAKGSEGGQAVKTNGTMWTWGRDESSSGINGQNNTVTYSSPIQVGALTNWVKCLHYGGAGGIKSDGTLWRWGSNTLGQCGDGTTANRSSPVQVLIPELMDSSSTSKYPQHIMPALNHYRAVSNTGSLMTWGRENAVNFGAELYRFNGGGQGSYREYPVTLNHEHDWTRVHVMTGSYGGVRKTTPIDSTSTWQNVVLRLPCDGTNGATTTTDYSDNGQTITFNGNAQVSTTQSKFGGASLSFDGTGDYISFTPTSGQWNIGRQRWQLDFWIYVNALPGTSAHIFDAYTNDSAFELKLNSSGQLNWTFTGAGTDNCTTTLSTGQWYHVRVYAVGSGSRTYVYINGAQGGMSSVASGNLNNITSAITIGADNNGNNGLNGYLDDIRFMIGGNEGWTGNIAASTTPTAALPTS